jgi:hypothetical protein
MTSRPRISEATLAFIEWAVLVAIGGGVLLLLF